MPKDKQRESKLPGYTVEDDPVLDRPKSRKGKTPRHQRQSPRASQRKFQSPRAILGEAVTSALNARN